MVERWQYYARGAGSNPVEDMYDTYLYGVATDLARITRQVFLQSLL